MRWIVLAVVLLSGCALVLVDVNEPECHLKVFEIFEYDCKSAEPDD